MMTREDWKGLTILTVCALALGGLFSLQIIFALEPTDWGSLCRTDQPLERATIVVIDKTDPFSEGQTETLRNRLLAVKDSLAQFERLAIHVLGSDDEAIEGKRQKRFSLCNPGQRKDVSKYYRNPALAQQKYNETFRREFDELLVDLLQPGKAAYSPIIDTFFGAVSQEDDVKASKVKRVVLFTDLLEHTPHMSFYKRGATLQDMLRRVPNGSRAWVEGANVKVFVVRRDGMLEHQNTVLVPLWRQFFSALGITANFEFI